MGWTRYLGIKWVKGDYVRGSRADFWKAPLKRMEMWQETQENFWFRNHVKSVPNKYKEVQCKQWEQRFKDEERESTVDISLKNFDIIVQDNANTEDRKLA